MKGLCHMPYKKKVSQPNLFSLKRRRPRPNLILVFTIFKDNIDLSPPDFFCRTCRPGFEKTPSEDCNGLVVFGKQATRFQCELWIVEKIVRLHGQFIPLSTYMLFCSTSWTILHLQAWFDLQCISPICNRVWPSIPTRRRGMLIKRLLGVSFPFRKTACKRLDSPSAIS